MAMGYRYSEGIAGFETNCEAAFLYFEPAAYQTVLHVSDTHGLDTVQFKKLDFGQYILDKELQIDENTQIEMKGATNDDIEQMIEFQGSYGDAQSLSFKGQQYMHQPDKTSSTYKKAYKAFQEALEIDYTNRDALYYIGLMHLLGYGRDQDIPKALEYFDNESLQKDARAMNA